MSTAAIAPERCIRIRSATYPVDLPRLRDARLHSSLVVLTLHVLGQVAFGFRVSVPQILSAIVSSAVVEVLITAHRTHRIAWPASAILTGSGVGLILRVNDTRAWDHWTWHAWYLYAGTAVFSLASKYIIRHRGEQIFNPSNLGLLAVFVLLGSSRVEPLDLWWHEWGVATAVAYVAILLGGILITHRLGLLGMAASFWATLGAGSALLAWSGHCITTNWSTRPICDHAFTRLLLTSPEILVFTFFMLTDPKTAPRSSSRRVAFGAAVAVVSVFLFASATTEFATKVSLFAGLAIVCAMRAVSRAQLLQVPMLRTRRLLSSDHGVLVIGASLPLLIGSLGLALVQLGVPARTAYAISEHVTLPDPRTVSQGLETTTPPRIVSYEPLVTEIDPRLATSNGREQLARALALALSVENQALRVGDESLLLAVDHGSRLHAMRTRIRAKAVPRQFKFGEARLLAVRAGGQGGLVIGVECQIIEAAQSGPPSTPKKRVYGVRAYRDDRWLLVDEWASNEVQVVR